MKTFHVMRTYGNHGGERQLAQMFAQKADVEEHFHFLYRDDACEALFAPSGLRLHRLWPFALQPRYRPWLELVWLVPLLPIMQLRLLASFLRHKPQACIVHGFQAALVAWPVAVLLGKKIGFAYFHRITKSGTGKHPLFRLIYKPYQKLVGVSLAVRDSLADFGPRERLLAIENGIDLSRMLRAPATNPPVIIAVGRLLPHKGQRLIIEAFSQLSTEFPAAELWVVGSGDDYDPLAALAKPFNGRVKLLGRREDIAQLLSQAMIFCHASDWEGMSNSVLEGMAAGLPSVVADAPGVTECHENNVTGFVVARSAAALADKIRLLLGDADLRARMGEAAFTRVSAHYSIQANRQKFLALYKELAACAAS